MNYKIIINFILILFISNCNQTNLNTNKTNITIENRYSNLGFALIYNDELKNIKKIDNNSLNIFHKTLKKRSRVKITNPDNGKSLIAFVVSNKVNFSSFYNSVLSLRIAETLDLNLDEPYIQLTLIPKNSSFVAKKAKTFDEEKNVAEKAPIDGVQISDLSKKVKQKKILKKKIFSYSIKIADFYYKDSAKILVKRINEKTPIKDVNIIKISQTKYRVLLGPFNDIRSIRLAFEQIESLNFENLEILKDV